MVSKLTGFIISFLEYFSPSFSSKTVNRWVKRISVTKWFKSPPLEVAVDVSGRGEMYRVKIFLAQRGWILRLGLVPEIYFAWLCRLFAQGTLTPSPRDQAWWGWASHDRVTPWMASAKSVFLWKVRVCNLQGVNTDRHSQFSCLTCRCRDI